MSSVYPTTYDRPNPVTLDDLRQPPEYPTSGPETRPDLRASIKALRKAGKMAETWVPLAERPSHSRMPANVLRFIGDTGKQHIQQITDNLKALDQAKRAQKAELAQIKQVVAVTEEGT